MCIARVRNRVMAGGHHVTRGRHRAVDSTGASVTFGIPTEIWSISGICTTISGEQAQEVAVGKANQSTVINENLFELFMLDFYNGGTQ